MVGGWEDATNGRGREAESGWLAEGCADMWYSEENFTKQNGKVVATKRVVRKRHPVTCGLNRASMHGSPLENEYSVK